MAFFVTLAKDVKALCEWLQQIVGIGLVSDELAGFQHIDSPLAGILLWWW